MLTRATTSRSLRARLATTVLSALSATMIYALAAPSHAQAAPPRPNCTANWSYGKKQVTYDCRDAGRPGRAGRPGARNARQPSCELTGQATFCVGPDACWIVPDDQRSLYDPPTTPPPTPGAAWQVRACITNTGYWRVITTAFWPTAPTPVNLAVAARQAIGNLHLPRVTAASAPPVQTLVNLDTWFAPTGPVQSPVRGTSALGVVAVATITGLAVDPGDGTAAFTCPPTVALNRTAGCNHTYRRSSAGQTATTLDHKPGYTVRTWTTWRINFLHNNAPITIPGAPTTVNGPTTTRILPVAESQAIVVD